MYPKLARVRVLVAWAVITPSVIVKASIIVEPDVLISESVPMIVLPEDVT